MLTNQQKFDRALVLGAVFGVPFNSTFSQNDKDHECDALLGEGKVRKGKLQIASGLGFYMSFGVDGPDGALNNLVCNQPSWYDGGQSASYAACTILGVRSGGYFDKSGKWADPGSRILIGLKNTGNIIALDVEENAVKFFTACNQIDTLRNANQDLASVNDSDDDDDEEDEF